jgi:hypothetical protein
MSCVSALRASAPGVRRMRSMDRRGNLTKDHPSEPLPGTCRPLGTANA